MIIGIDIGTTGTKTVLLDDLGSIVHYSYVGYACSYPQPHRVEQNMEDIRNAVIKTVRDCTACIPAGEQVETMSVSVQSGTLVPLYPDGRPYGSAISWLDTRCDKECGQLLQQYGEDIFYRKTGWKLSPSFNFIQICKIRQDAPEDTKDLIFANVSDYITHFLVGGYYTDVNSAGNLQLFNVEEGIWDPELLDMAKIRQDQLGKLVSSGAFLGYVTPDTAKLLGLGDRVQVYAGAQDQYCAAVGAGVHQPGQSMLSTGTSWVLMSITDRPRFNESSYPAVAKHIVGDYYANFVYTPAGGSALKWLKNSILADDLIGDTLTYDMLTQAAEQISAGSDGLYFLPYLGGTLFPSWSDQRGMFYGLDFSHDRRHMIRAVMEGVAFELNLMMDSLGETGQPVRSLHALGGATRSGLWMQTVADIANVPIVASSVADIAPIGAAIIAAVGCGMYSDYAAACKAFRCLEGQREFHPTEAGVQMYGELFQKYRRLSQNLQRGEI